MVTFLILVFVLIDSVLVAFILVFPFLFAVVLWLQASFLLVLRFRSKPGLGLAHLAELLIPCLLIIFEYLVLLILLVLVLQFLDNGFGLLLTLAVLQVVGV